MYVKHLIDSWLGAEAGGTQQVEPGGNKCHQENDLCPVSPGTSEL
jgi:hypothetical protein